MNGINNSNSLVSVIIPCFNGEAFIVEAIQSVINQSCENWELIVVDDNSGDGSKAIVKRYVNDRIRLIEQEYNHGIPKTKNVGISVAKGAYITFLDQDDLWLPTKLTSQIEQFEMSSARDVGIVCTGMLSVDESKTKIKLFKGFNDSKQENLIKSLYLTPINSSSIMMIKRKSLNKAGLFDEQLVGWDDYELLMRVATHYDIRYVRKPLTVKRIHHDNMQNSPAVTAEYKKVFEHIVTLHPFLAKYKHMRDSMDYCNEAMHLLKENNTVIARQVFKKSIKTNPFYLEAILLYMLSFLPGRLPLLLKDMKRRTVSFMLKLKVYE